MELKRCEKASKPYAVMLWTTKRLTGGRMYHARKVRILIVAGSAEGKDGILV